MRNWKFREILSNLSTRNLSAEFGAFLENCGIPTSKFV